MHRWLRKAISHLKNDWRHGVRGALRGEPPRKREGRNGPTVRRQWPVAGGPRLHEVRTAPWLPEVPESLRRLWDPPQGAEDFGGLTNVRRLTMIPALPDELPLSTARALCQKLPALP